jgi:hypothetical protein
MQALDSPENNGNDGRGVFSSRRKMGLGSSKGIGALAVSKKNDGGVGK